MYASVEDYKNISRERLLKDDEQISRSLAEAECNINSLTFNRITAKGFENLTDFQKDIVRKCTVWQADYNAAYSDTLASPLSSYGINGVSMGFDKSKVVFQSGVYTSPEIYSTLIQTGLCFRGLC